MRTSSATRTWNHSWRLLVLHHLKCTYLERRVEVYISTWSTSTMINLQHWRPLYRKSISGMECVLGQVASSLRTTTINLRAEIIYVTDFARYVTWVWSKMNNMWFSNAPFTTISGKINGGLIFLIRLWAEWIFLCLKGGSLRFMSSYFELSEDDSQFLIAPLGQYPRTKNKNTQKEDIWVFSRLVLFSLILDLSTPRASGLWRRTYLGVDSVVFPL